MPNDNRYTPTTNDVREVIVECSLLVAEEAGVAPPPIEQTLAEFDRWLAAHDAEVAAKALRDAAKKIISARRSTWGYVNNHRVDPNGDASVWLFNRAHALGAPGQEGTP